MRKEIANYIELIIRIGINIQKGQILVVSAPVETFEFTRKVVETAYKFGAKEVVINWTDEVCGKYRYFYGAEEIFNIYPKHQADMMKDYAEKGAAFLSIYATDPEILKECRSRESCKSSKS